MTEQALEAAMAPVVAVALEDLHQQASAEITRLEAAIPPRLEAAEQDVKNWAHDALTTLHGLVARIDQHRQGANATPATAGPTQPAAASTPPPTSTASATPAVSSTPGSAPAAAK